MSCHGCKIKDKPGTGCIDDASFPKWKIRDGEKLIGTYRRCPLKLISPEINFIFELYFAFKDRFPPVAGGYLDQTNHFIQAVWLIDSIRDKYAYKED